MSSWYRQFIRQFAVTSEPLTRLLEKNQRWDDEQHQAFEGIRAHLSIGIGADLVQNINEVENIIAFASRALSNVEKKYSWAIQKFRLYLEEYWFMVLTDHNSWLYNLRNSIGRLAKWAFEFLECDYKIIHRKEALHHVPDYRGEVVNAFLAAREEAKIFEDTEDPWYRRRLREISERPNALRGRWLPRMGPLLQSKAEFVYILVIQNLFTKSLRFLLTDNGTEFMNKTLQAFAAWINSKHIEPRRFFEDASEIVLEHVHSVMQHYDYEFFFILPFIIISVIFIHLFFLHATRSANPMGPHIQPEYFLFAYAILRSIPNKLGGVITFIISILYTLPLIKSRYFTSSSLFLTN
ncbi:CYB protein, partial [Acromyrmex heyeri]